jgi:hypothetical protein
LILTTLSLDSIHCWAIAKRIQQVSGEILQVQQGSLYPAFGEVLFADAGGAQATGTRNGELEPGVRSN